MTVPFAFDPARKLRRPEKAKSRARNARHTVQARAEIVKEMLGWPISGKLIVAKESNEVRTQCLFSEHCAIPIIVGDQPMRLTFRQRRQQ